MPPELPASQHLLPPPAALQSCGAVPPPGPRPLAASQSERGRGGPRQGAQPLAGGEEPRQHQQPMGGLAVQEGAGRLGQLAANGGGDREQVGGV